MIILGILVSIAAIGTMCWLLFNLAVFALPFFLGVNAAPGPMAQARDGSAQGSLASSRRG